MSTFMRGFAGCCGVPRGLSFGPMLGIECRFDSGDDPAYGFARRGTGSAGVNDVVVAVVAGVAGKKLAVVFCVFSFVLADIVGGEPLRDPDVSTTLELDPESLSPKLSLTSFAFPPPETSALRREPSCTLLAIQIHPYHD
jgi:hypothetical protein